MERNQANCMQQKLRSRTCTIPEQWIFLDSRDSKQRPFQAAKQLGSQKQKKQQKHDGFAHQTCKTRSNLLKIIILHEQHSTTNSYFNNQSIESSLKKLIKIILHQIYSRKNCLYYQYCWQIQEPLTEYPDEMTQLYYFRSNFENTPLLTMSWQQMVNHNTFINFQAIISSCDYDFTIKKYLRSHQQQLAFLLVNNHSFDTFRQWRAQIAFFFKSCHLCCNNIKGQEHILNHKQKSIVLILDEVRHQTVPLQQAQNVSLIINFIKILFKFIVLMISLESRTLQGKEWIHRLQVTLKRLFGCCRVINYSPKEQQNGCMGQNKNVKQCESYCKMLLLLNVVPDPSYNLQFFAFWMAGVSSIENIQHQLKQIGEVLQLKIEMKESGEARHKKRYSKISTQKRLKLIRMVLEEGLTLTKVAKLLRIKRPTAKVILKRYKANGTFFNKKNVQMKTKSSIGSQNQLKIEDKSEENLSIHLKEEELSQPPAAMEQHPVKGEQLHSAANLGYLYYFPPFPQYQSFM